MGRDISGDVFDKVVVRVTFRGIRKSTRHIKT
jgi:hypothetical protein